MFICTLAPPGCRPRLLLARSKSSPLSEARSAKHFTSKLGYAFWWKPVYFANQLLFILFYICYLKVISAWNSIKDETKQYEIMPHNFSLSTQRCSLETVWHSHTLGMSYNTYRIPVCNSSTLNVYCSFFKLCKTLHGIKHQSFQRIQAPELDDLSAIFSQSQKKIFHSKSKQKTIFQKKLIYESW